MVRLMDVDEVLGNEGRRERVQSPPRDNKCRRDAPINEPEDERRRGVKPMTRPPTPRQACP